jgi:hypothetical protein
MDRRNFLASLTALSGLVLDPERLLWVPRSKRIFIPPPHKTTKTYYHADLNKEGEPFWFIYQESDDNDAHPYSGGNVLEFLNQPHTGETHG